MEALFRWVQSWPVSQAIATSPWMFPAIECLHVLALAFVVGSIARVDLRLLGIIRRDRPITQMSAELLPYTWVGFALATASGAVLFASQAVRYAGIPYFGVKLALLAVAGLNMLLFQLLTYRGVARWDVTVRPPLPARLAGALSLMLWIGVVTMGRLIGFA